MVFSFILTGKSLHANPQSEGSSYIEDWTALVVAAFLLLCLGIMLGMFVEKSLKTLFLLNQRKQPIRAQSQQQNSISDKEMRGNASEMTMLPAIDRKLVSSCSLRTLVR